MVRYAIRRWTDGQWRCKPNKYGQQFTPDFKKAIVYNSTEDAEKRGFEGLSPYIAKVCEIKEIEI